MKVGFIGLGVMGAPMAGHLQRGGHELYVALNRSSLPHFLSENCTRCNCPRDVAENSEVVILMLPNTSDVETVLTAENGVIAGLTPGKTVVDMSTISSLATKQLADRVRKLDCKYVDAPVSGGETGAQAATLTIMVGADVESFARLKPLFALMGRHITHVGQVGDGQTAKAANQIVVALTIEAVAEALVFATKAGADPSKVRSALMGGFAASRVLEVHGERMINRKFSPGFRIDLHRKDLAIVLDGAQKLGVSLPNTALTQQLFASCASAGGGSLDHSSLILALERLSNHTVEPQS